MHNFSADPEIGNSSPDRILRMADRTAERRIENESVRDSFERRNEPGVLVRVDASQQVEDLNEQKNSGRGIVENCNRTGARRQ